MRKILLFAVVMLLFVGFESAFAQSNRPNRPPVANAGPDQTVFIPDTVFLYGSGVDPDGDMIAEYQWAVESYPGSQTPLIRMPYDQNPRLYYAPVPGDIVVSLRVSDGLLWSDPDLVVFHIFENQPPVIVTFLSSTEGTIPYTCAFDASQSYDPEGGQLLFSWSFGDGSTSNSAYPEHTYFHLGQYLATLVVQDERGAQSVEQHLITVLEPAPPVADAGPDQAIYAFGSTVALNGGQSYDPEGHPLTFEWTMVSIPHGSTATLANPSSATPTFVADVKGTYVLRLVVKNAWKSSNPDEVTVSFDNVKPVAVAGGNQSVSVGQTVLLDGSGSTDAEGDPLTYRWAFVSTPPGSTAVLGGATSPYANFLADLPGLYVVSLIVNDGKVDSQSNNAVISSVAGEVGVTQTLQWIIIFTNGLDSGVFQNNNLRHALTNKINDVLITVDKKRYQDALDKLQNDILAKTDGCAVSGAPDKNDWLRTCTAQGLIQPWVLDAINYLRGLAGGG